MSLLNYIKKILKEFKKSTKLKLLILVKPTNLTAFNSKDFSLLIMIFHPSNYHKDLKSIIPFHNEKIPNLVESNNHPNKKPYLNCFKKSKNNK